MTSFNMLFFNRKPATANRERLRNEIVLIIHFHVNILGSGATSLFDVGRWAFDVGRSFSYKSADGSIPADCNHVFRLYASPACFSVVSTNSLLPRIRSSPVQYIRCILPGPVFLPINALWPVRSLAFLPICQQKNNVPISPHCQYLQAKIGLQM